MNYELAFDTTDAVGESIRDVVTTLGMAIFFVILVIFIFLEDWRSTIIPAVTIPVSLIGTFAFVKLLGFSINTLTLFGITLATGLVVDDAIVVIENIERHLQEGETDPLKAASSAMKEVTGAVIATSLVLVAVFVPVAFFPGTTGILFRQFALTIAFSIAISAFNALSLTPSLSALLLGREHGEKSWLFKRVDRSLAALTNGYRSRPSRFLHFEAVALILFVAGLGLAYFVFRHVPQGFVPNEDQGYLFVVIQAPTGASVEYTRNIGEQVNAISKNIPEIEGIFSVAGFSFGRQRAERRHRLLSLNRTRSAKAASTPPPQSSIGCAAPSSEFPARSSSPSNRPPCKVWASLADSNSNFRIRAITRCRISTSHARPHPRRRRAQKRPRRTVHHLHRQRSAVCHHHRSRKSQEPAHSAQPDHRHAQRLHGLGLRQRFRFQQPFLSGLRAGRQAIPLASAGHRASTTFAPIPAPWFRSTI